MQIKELKGKWLLAVYRLAFVLQLLSSQTSGFLEHLFCLYKFFKNPAIVHCNVISIYQRKIQATKMRGSTFLFPKHLSVTLDGLGTGLGCTQGICYLSIKENVFSKERLHFEQGRWIWVESSILSRHV